eukprot:COSAG01_NODE_704_length_14147_cov_5.083648_2_plen_127_part_00
MGHACSRQAAGRPPAGAPGGEGRGLLLTGMPPKRPSTPQRASRSRGSAQVAERRELGSLAGDVEATSAPMSLQAPLLVSASPDRTEASPKPRQRLASLDLLRGLIMMVMAWCVCYDDLSLLSALHL